MRILCVGSGLSIHTVRWVRGLAERGHELHLATQHDLREPLPEARAVHRLPFRGEAGYFLNAAALRRISNAIHPDVLHVHYASGYATTARLSRPRRPIVLTVWGSDVLEFPWRSALHRVLLRANLRSAVRITSASQYMADAVRALVPSASVAVVPFGVDSRKFAPARTSEDGETAIVGTVKGLDLVYGVDVLVRAFAMIRCSDPQAHSPRLVIAGAGSTEHLRSLARELGIAGVVDFVGDVRHGDVPRVLRTFAVYAALSRRESFGVAVLEASACAVPVVTTKVGGLPEVVLDGKTGLLVDAEDPAAAARAIRTLLDDRVRAAELGRAGRQFVQAHFEWDASVDAMSEVLHSAAQGWPGG